MKAIQVLVDGIVFENSRQIGIWRIFYEIMRRTTTHIEYTLLLAGKPHQPIPEGVRIEFAWHRSQSNQHTYAGRIARKLKKIAVARKHEDAIWHSSFFTTDPRSNASNVVTIYDMIAERYFYWGGDWAEAQHEQKKQAISLADEIVAISKTTAEDIKRFYPNIDKEIAIIPLGIEHLNVPQDAMPDQSANPFALFVGLRNSYKNFSLILEALASKRWPSDLPLKVVGAPFSSLEQSLVNYFGVTDKVECVGRLKDSELSEVYRRSTCFIFPSLAEGFGLPILEAQANASVPILSDIPVFREVAGDGALFFDPRDCDSLCDAVHQALDGYGRQKIVAAAKENVLRYSWDAAAEEMVNVYSRLRR